jgi:hypothetical protein
MSTSRIDLPVPSHCSDDPNNGSDAFDSLSAGYIGRNDIGLGLAKLPGNFPHKPVG